MKHCHEQVTQVAFEQLNVYKIILVKQRKPKPLTNALTR